MKISKMPVTNFCAVKKRKKNKENNTNTRKSIYSSNPKLSHTKDFDRVEIKNEKELQKYSREKLSSLLNQITVTTIDKGELDITSDIEEKLKKGDVEASDTEMLLELVLDDKLSVLNLYFQYPKTSYNKNFTNDIDTVYIAYCEEKPLKELLIPSYSTKKEAKTKTKIGDIFTIGQDETIQIKTPKGIKKMFISKEACLKLFPPIERYASHQYLYGDCYLISAFDALYQNPFSRDIILSRFAQGKNSQLKASLKGYKRTLFNEVKLKHKNDTEIENVETKIAKKMKNYPPSPQPKALSVFELLREEYLADNTLRLIEAQKEKFKNFPKDKDFCFIDGFKYSREEIELFLSLTKNPTKDKLNYKYLNLLSIDLFELSFTFKTKALENFISILKQLDIKDIDKDNPLSNLNKDEFKYFTLTLERYLEYAKRKGKKYIDYNPLTTYRILCYLCQIENNCDFKTYLDFPSSSNIFFKSMGLKTKLINLKTKNYSTLLLHDKNFSKKYTACASIADEENSDNEFLQNSHSYSLSVDNGKILIRNPMNTSRERAFSIKEFLEKFSNLHLVKIR